MEKIAHKVGANMVVSLDYVLTVDGEIADSTIGKEPLPYLHGHNNLISGLERQLAGMVVGESKSVVVPAKEAYGEMDPEAFIEMERNKFPDSFTFEIGKTVRLNAGDGRILTSQIVMVTEDTIKLDYNHPLAGKDLHFDVTIADLREALDVELAHGHVQRAGCNGCHGSCDSCG